MPSRSATCAQVSEENNSAPQPVVNDNKNDASPGAGSPGADEPREKYLPNLNMLVSSLKNKIGNAGANENVLKVIRVSADASDDGLKHVGCKGDTTENGGTKRKLGQKRKQNKRIRHCAIINMSNAFGADDGESQ